jgi:hypothetical protein
MNSLTTYLDCKLEVIDCRDCHLTDNDIVGIRELPDVVFQHCKVLKFGFCPITDMGVGRTVRRFPSLEYLDLSECDHVTDKGLRELGVSNLLHKP